MKVIDRRVHAKGKREQICRYLKWDLVLYGLDYHLYQIVKAPLFSDYRLRCPLGSEADMAVNQSAIAELLVNTNVEFAIVDGSWVALLQDLEKKFKQ